MKRFSNWFLCNVMFFASHQWGTYLYIHCIPGDYCHRLCYHNGRFWHDKHMKISAFNEKHLSFPTSPQPTPLAGLSHEIRR